jgi:hypothetical protein
VVDTIAPELALPASITEQAASAAGAQVSFTASATDAISGPRLVTCVPASGATFPIGVTTVNCSAADAAGNSAAGSFTVTVADTTAPLLQVPAGVTAEAGSAAGQAVTYTAIATDAVTAAPVIACAPASGLTFPIGVTPVHCTAVDAAGNSAGGAFMVTVADTTAPQLIVPADISAPAGSSAGQVVSYTVSATDAVTGSPVVTCAPASGTTFPIGVTLVQCSASDAAGNSASDSFAVTITATVAGRLHGAGSIGSNAAKISFRLDVRAAASGDSGSLVLKIGTNDFSAGVSVVTFASASRLGASDPVSFTGSGSWNGRPGYVFHAAAADNGEPGRGRDTLSFVVYSPEGVVVASGAGTLTTGNIQSLR